MYDSPGNWNYKSGRLKPCLTYFCTSIRAQKSLSGVFNLNIIPILTQEAFNHVSMCITHLKVV